MTAKLSAEERPLCVNPQECCRALSRAWAALGITEYNGKSIEENIVSLLAQVREAEALIADLQAHAKEAGWQDVDEPIAALLAYPLPPSPAQRQGRTCAECDGSGTFTAAEMRLTGADELMLCDGTCEGEAQPCSRVVVNAMLRQGADAESRWEQLKARAHQFGYCDLEAEMARLEKERTA